MEAKVLLLLFLDGILFLFVVSGVLWVHCNYHALFL